MKNILNFVGAGAIVLLLLSNTVNMSDKPPTPKSVLVKDFHSKFSIQTDITKYIKC